MMTAAERMLVWRRNNSRELFLRIWRMCAIIPSLMPITVGAIRKLRADAKKTRENVRTRRNYKDLVATMRRKATKKTLSLAYRALDRAAKRGVIHKNKAARLKSRLAKKL